MPPNTRAREKRGIYRASSDAKSEARCRGRGLAADWGSAYFPSPSGSGAGSLLFLRDGTLMQQSFDGRSQVMGEPIPIAEDVGNTGSYGWFSASASGALAFRTGRGSGTASALLWLDRQGKRLGQV